MQTNETPQTAHTNCTHIAVYPNYRLQPSLSLSPWQPASCMEDGENDPVVRQTSPHKARERKRDEGVKRCVGGTSHPERPAACNDWLRACSEGSSERGRGAQRAHLQWRVLYWRTDSAINHRVVERGGKLDRKEWSYKEGKEVTNERKRGELLRGIQRQSNFRNMRNLIDK